MEDFSHFGKPKPPKRNWWTIFIFSLFTFLIGMTLIMVGASVVVPKVINSTVESYTDAEPTPMPEVEYTEEFIEEPPDSFVKALTEEPAREPGAIVKPVEELTLDADELNALLYADDSLRDTVRLSFNDGRLRTQLSIPLDSDVSIGPWRASMQGRFINGVAEMDVALGATGLEVKLASFEVGGRTVPDWLLDRLQAEIDKEGYLESEDVQKIMGQLKGVEIIGDQLVLSPKTP